MTIRFTATHTILNGNTVTASRDERKQLAIMLKKKLGLV